MGSVSPGDVSRGLWEVLAVLQVWISFQVPHLTEELDEDGVRFIYMRREHEDRMVVPYNPDIAILWGALHNVQRVSKHRFEQHLAKYISKAEPSSKIQLPENASLPEVSPHTCGQNN